MKVKTLIEKLSQIDPETEVTGNLCETKCFDLVVCPNCGKVISYNYYFHSYICDCGYEHKINLLELQIKK